MSLIKAEVAALFANGDAEATREEMLRLGYSGEECRLVDKFQLEEWCVVYDLYLEEYNNLLGPRIERRIGWFLQCLAGTSAALAMLVTLLFGQGETGASLLIFVVAAAGALGAYTMYCLRKLYKKNIQNYVYGKTKRGRRISRIRTITFYKNALNLYNSLLEVDYFNVRDTDKGIEFVQGYPDELRHICYENASIRYGR